MPLESATYISQLDPDLPTGTGADGDIAEGDDVLRLIKAVLVASFPNVSGAVTATHTQLNTVTLKAAKAGDTYTGAHDFTGATPTVATLTVGDNTTGAASTAFVQAAVAAVNASGATTLTVETGAAVTASAGTHYVLTYAGTVTVTLPASPSAGNTVVVTVANGRTDTVIARNALKIMGLSEDLTLDFAYASVQLRYIDAANGWRIV